MAAKASDESVGAPVKAKAQFQLLIKFRTYLLKLNCIVQIVAIRPTMPQINAN